MIVGKLMPPLQQTWKLTGGLEDYSPRKGLLSTFTIVGKRGGLVDAAQPSNDVPGSNAGCGWNHPKQLKPEHGFARLKRNAYHHVHLFGTTISGSFLSLVTLVPPARQQPSLSSDPQNLSLALGELPH